MSGERVQRAGGDHEDFFCRGHPDGRGRRPRRVEKCYREVDKQKMLDRCEEKSPEVAREIGWAKLWDSCLDLGGAYVSGLQRVSVALAQGSTPMPLL